MTRANRRTSGARSALSTLLVTVLVASCARAASPGPVDLQTLVASRASTDPTTLRPAAGDQMQSPPTLRSHQPAEQQQQQKLVKSAPSASAPGSWIERILIRVENINMVQAARHHHHQQQVEPSSSLSPTDSAEDLLEATSTQASSTSSNPRYGFANPVTFATMGEVLSIELPGEQEQPAVEPARSDNRLSCEQAYTACALRKVCAPTLRAYNEHCADLIANRTGECSAKCLRAMVALRSSDEGDNLAICDCGNNPFCEQSKQRSRLCESQVGQAIEPQSVVSCSTASAICMADQLCSTALEYYYRNCQSLFSQRYCSLRCNNSLSILYRQPKAHKLINCRCDGTEEFPCTKYKTYTERLCLNKPATSGLPDSQLPPDEGANVTIDDDQANALVLDADLAPSSSFASSKINDTADDDETSDEHAAANDHNNNFALFDAATDESDGDSGSVQNADGFQSVEDNWIPLMSGRYFTNLQQQQQQQLQQRGQQRKQVALLGAAKSNLATSQQDRPSKPTHKTLRDHRSARHRNVTRTRLTSGGLNQNRGWYGNIIMLASSASSAGASLKTSSPSMVATNLLLLFVCLVLFVNLRRSDSVFRVSLLLH